MGNTPELDLIYNCMGMIWKKQSNCHVYLRGNYTGFGFTWEMRGEKPSNSHVDVRGNYTCISHVSLHGKYRCNPHVQYAAIRRLKVYSYQWECDGN